MTYREYVSAGKHRIEKAGIECSDALRHMQTITEAALGISSGQLHSRWDESISDAHIGRVEEILTPRLSGMPLQYILGRSSFWKNEFVVHPGVLIPRPETEHLLEVLYSRTSHSPIKIAELGAGTGNVGISVVMDRPTWTWHAFEKGKAAYRCANENAERLKVGAGYQLHLGDFFELASWHEPYHWIVSNPPYIPTSEVQKLSIEVRQEPLLALDGGEDGLDIIRRILRTSRRLLVDGGGVALEIGAGQLEIVTTLMGGLGYQGIDYASDYSGIPRVVVGYWNRGTAWMH